MLVLAGITLVLVSAADAGAMSHPAKQWRSSEANTLRAIERKRLHALVDADTSWEQATAMPNDFGLFVQSLLPPEPPS
jgi:hypothetical protein